MMFLSPTLLVATLTALPLMGGSPGPIDDAEPKAPELVVEFKLDKKALKKAKVDGVAPHFHKRGKGMAPLMIPRDEHLGFGVYVSLGPIGATVGDVALDSGVEAYQESLLMAPPPSAEKGDSAWLRAKAKGSYMWYEMKTVLDSRYLPQKWPSISHQYRQTGSENRRREGLFGLYEDRQQSSYRADTSRGAPEGERIWKEAVFRDIPKGTLDMLGAVYLSRVLLLSGEETLVFPLLDRTTLWELTLRLGERKVVEVPAGSFNAVEVILDPKAYPDEPENKKKKKFEGLFGIRGSIHLWVDETTGVPVRISGTIPAGPVEIDCDIYLEEFTGTPDAFVPIAVPTEDKDESDD